MRAFLGSASLAALPAWLAELPRRPARALLVPTAGNRLKTTPWVQSTITQLETCGVAVTTFDLEGAHRSDTLAALGAADLIWVTGGHPIFLLQHARASGFLDLVRSRVQAGQLYYAGVSSGAALAAPDLAAYRGPDDPGVVDDTTGLDLVPFYPLVHANRGREQRYAALVRAHPKTEFVTLTDNQAVIVTDDTWRRAT